MITSSPKLSLVHHSTDMNALVYICSSSYTNTFRIIALFYRGIICIIGLFFAFRIRDIDDQFNVNIHTHAYA